MPGAFLSKPFMCCYLSAIGKRNLETFNYNSMHRAVRLMTEVKAVFNARPNAVPVEHVSSGIRPPGF